MSSTSLHIFSGDVKPDTSYTTLVCRGSATTVDVVLQCVEKLQLSESGSFYELYVGSAGDDRSTWRLLEEEEYPVVVLEQEKKASMSAERKGKEKGLFLTKKWQSNPLLMGVVESASTETLSLADMNDLCKLEDLSEQRMLDILQARFEKDLIYTYAGTILIAINPYHFYSIYNPKYSSMYCGKHLGELPPHIYAVADDAYSSMLNDKMSQAMIISGESGAGKTESTKFLLHQLMQLSAKYEETSSLELITLGTGPVLEAFGNAKTIANNNSSRFGKFILIKFKENGAYFGASIEKYLLEKSRIVSQSSRERNYHVFYYLLSGADEMLREKLHLLHPDEYNYLGQHTVVPLEGVDEVTEFQRLCQCLSMLKFSGEVQTMMFTVLSAILRIGNVEFTKNEADEKVHISDMRTVDIVSRLLQVETGTLCSALTIKKSQAGRGMDSFVTYYRLDEAIATRDAMAKALYGALFDWIVDKVNAALAIRNTTDVHKGNTIGVLDIFGFEVFDKNSFEQFCINFANEQLQQYFNKHIFKVEQEEYNAEGITWHAVGFIDNTECLDLILKKPTGLLPLLDEECSFPGADDYSLFQKFERQHKNHPCYSSPQMKHKEPIFTVAHYVSPVTYSIMGFREKNRDLMRQDVVDVLKTSKMDLVRALIGLPPYAIHRWHIAVLAVMAMLEFQKCSEKLDVRRELDGSASAPAICDASVEFVSPSTSPEPLRVLSPVLGDSDSEYSGSRPSTPILSVGSDDHGRDSPDEAIRKGNGRLPVDRHPSVAYLFKNKGKKKWHTYGKAEKSAKSSTRLLPSQAATVGKKQGTSSKLLQMMAQSPVMSRRSQSKTVSAQFHSSLGDLMEQLASTHPYFIRCLKSNNNKAPMQFDQEVVAKQLRYTGMMGTVHIRRTGFPVRVKFDDFYKKYEFLIGSRQADLPKQIQDFLSHLGFKQSDIQLGKTKVFMRNHQKRVLQDLLASKVLAKIVLIQRWIRAKLLRCRFLHMRRSIILIQSVLRGWLARRKTNKMLHQLCAAVVIQSSWRGYVARKAFLESREAAIHIQAVWRGWNQRQKYAVTLAEWRQQQEEKRRQAEQKRRLEKEKEEREFHMQKMREQEEQHQRKLLQDELEKQKRKQEVSILERTKQPVAQVVDTVSSQSEDITTESSTFEAFWDDVDQTMAELDAMLHRMSESDSETIAQSSPTSHQKPSEMTQKGDEIRILVTSATTKDDTSLSAPLNEGKMDSILQKFSPAQEKQKKPTEPLRQNAEPSGNVKSLIAQMQDTPSASSFQPTRANVPLPKKLSDRIDIFSQKEQSAEQPIRKVPSAAESPRIKRLQSPFLANVKAADVSVSKPTKSSLSPPLDGVDAKPLGSQTVAVSSSKPKSDEQEELSQVAHVENRIGQAAGLSVSVTDEVLEDMAVHPLSADTDEECDETIMSLVLANPDAEFALEDEEEVFPNSQTLAQEEQPMIKPGAQVHGNISAPRDAVSDLIYSSQLTRSMSPDTLYQLNFQQRYSCASAPYDSSDRLSDSSPTPGKGRFVVKRRNKLISPIKSLRNIRQNSREKSSGWSRFQKGSSPSDDSLIPHDHTEDPEMHLFKSLTGIKNHTCAVCNKSFSGFLKQGSKCVACNVMVHRHCQNRAPSCEKVIPRAGSIMKMGMEKVIRKPEDWDELAQFLLEKHLHLVQALTSEDVTKPLDRVFQMALSEFHASLVSNYSLALQEPEMNATPTSSNSFTFNHLVNKFTTIYRSMAKREELKLDSSDVAICINQIRTFLGEFVKRKTQPHGPQIHVVPPTKPKPRRRKKAPALTAAKEVKVHKGHRFHLTQFKVKTGCDHCSKLISVLEKGEVCEECSFACHEACMKKLNKKCEGKGRAKAHPPEEAFEKESQFGIPLEKVMLSKTTGVPIVLEKCFSAIEGDGLYSQGIYRKSAGISSKRTIREALNTDPEAADMENFSLHAVAATISSFFRELPEPLLTRDMYIDFIRATDITDHDEMMKALYELLERLPDLNHRVFERLIFHMARIAQHHSVNKMDPHNLAIIFAPSLLQGHEEKTPDQLLLAMPKQTLVLESIINEQVKKLDTTLRDIHELSTVASTTVRRLTALSERTRSERDKVTVSVVSKSDTSIPSTTQPDQKYPWLMEDAEKSKRIEGSASDSSGNSSLVKETQLLTSELREIERERAELTASLPRLQRFSASKETVISPLLPTRLGGGARNLDTHNRVSLLTPGRDEITKNGKDDIKRNWHVTSAKDSISLSTDTKPAAVPSLTLEEEDTLPDLPSVLLKPLTKNRVERRSKIQRKLPTKHHFKQPRQ